MIGASLGRYFVESKLGERGIGQVYRAKDTKLGRAVALKVISSDLAAGAGFRSGEDRWRRGRGHSPCRTDSLVISIPRAMHCVISLRSILCWSRTRDRN